METSGFCAELWMRGVKRIFTYGGTPMLSFSARYPQIALRCNPAAQKSIRREIRAQVGGVYRDASGELYRLAVSDYRNSLENGFPFHRYDVMLQYTITCRRACRLSLYRDQYAYTGGAHGSTVRASDTWDLRSGQKLPLASFFPGKADYRSFVIGEITRQADEKMRKTPGVLFENYRDLIPAAFDETHCYLTPQGVAVYYQQYEIAPYSTGIVVFMLPCAAE